jgi:hypothetical protein
MALSFDRLGRTFIELWNKVPVDQASVDRLGDAMYDGMMAIVIDQTSNPNGDLGRLRARETARAILEEMMNVTGECASKRAQLMAMAIVHEIKLYAEIQPLTVSNTPADGAAHTHAPALTVQAAGKIR